MQSQSFNAMCLRFLVCWVVGYLCLLRGDSFFEVEDHSVSAVAVEIIAMQAFRPQETQSFVEFERGYIINLSFQCNLFF